MQRSIAAAALAVVCLAAPPPCRADVRLSINEGVVSLSATNATIAQILAEWGRVGRTTIVNGERVGGGPVTLEMTNTPEDKALDTPLRATAGYLAAPRPLAVPSASRFDRILIIPVSTAPRVAAPVQPAFQPPAFQPPAFAPQVPPVVQADESESADRQAPIMPVAPRAPGFGAFPNGSSAPPPTGDVVMPPQGLPGPTMPIGSATPGMIIQPPASTTQVPTQAPTQPGVPPRPQGR